MILQIDEVQDFVDACYLCAPEAVWHIFGFKLHHRSPAIQRLQIHLPNEQTMTFHDNTDITTLLQNEHAHKTSLMEFFTANQQVAAAAAAANGEPLDFDCRELLYQEFPTHMTLNRGHRRWNRRKTGFGKTIGRMYFVGPSGGERFYLHMLLTVVKGPTSFEDLHTYDGVVHQTFKSACIACGLLDSDEQWDHSLTEAELWQGGSQLRQLFVCILLHCYPTDALQLWINHAQHLSDDCRHRLQTVHHIDDPSEEQVHSHTILMFNRSIHLPLALFEISSIRTILISINTIFLHPRMSLHLLFSMQIDWYSMNVRTISTICETL